MRNDEPLEMTQAEYDRLSEAYRFCNLSGFNQYDSFRSFVEITRKQESLIKAMSIQPGIKII